MGRRYREPLDRCIKIAARQYGVISRSQALRAGISRHAINRLLADGIWKRIHEGTYAIWTPEDPQHRWRHHLMAGALWLGTGSALSHRAAGMLWECDGIDQSPHELSTRGRKRLEGTSPAGLVLHHPRNLPAEDIVVRKGLPVTAVPRTLLDLASVVDICIVERALESVLRRRLTTLHELQAALARSSRSQVGRAALRDLLAQHPGVPTDSPLETRTWQVFRESGLPMPVRQYLIRNRAGRPVAKPDLAYPEFRFAIEVDGLSSRSNRRDFEKTTTKQNRLLALGWMTYHVTAGKLRHPRVVVGEIAELLRMRRQTDANTPLP